MSDIPKFENREEYEKWKARRLKELWAIELSKKPPEKEAEPGGGGGGPEGQPGKAPRQADELPEIGDLFRKSWEIYKRRGGVLVGLYLLSILFFVFSTGIFIGAAFVFSRFFPGVREAVLAVGGLLGATLGSIVFFWGLAALVYAVTDEDLGVRDALDRGGARIWSFLWFYSIAGFIVTGGFLLFIIPGIIFLTWFAFGQFVLACEDIRGMSAMLKSKEYVKERWFDVFLRLFLVWLVSVGVGMIPLIGPLLSLLFMPYMLVFTYLLYQDLRTLKDDPVYPDSAKEKFKWLGAATLGYIFFPLMLISMLGASLAVLCYSLRTLVVQ
jgi:hypothetical protein